jgi:hypothetical protein
MPVLGDLLGRVRLKNQKTGLGEFRTLQGPVASDLAGRTISSAAGLVPLPNMSPTPRPVPANAGGGLFQQLLSALQQNPDMANRVPTPNQAPIRNTPVPETAAPSTNQSNQSGIRSDLETSIQPVKPIQPTVSTRARRNRRNRRFRDGQDRSRDIQAQIRQDQRGAR